MPKILPHFSYLTINPSEMNKQICRLCSAYTWVSHSLLENDHFHMLKSLTGIQVHSSDDTSTECCLKCMLNLKSAYSIQQKILKADAKLKDVDVFQWEEASDIKSETKEIVSIPLCNSTCLFCEDVLNVNDLSGHVKEHFLEKQYCDLCNRHLANLEEYKRHVLSEHEDEKNAIHLCGECDSIFQYKSLYHIHMARVHKIFVGKHKNRVTVKKEEESVEEIFTCETCNKEFNSEKLYNQHSHVKKECHICHAKISRSNFNKHVSNHTSGPQVCELCGSTLRSVESLRGHMSHTHSTKVFKCGECDKTFNKRYPYIMHKKKHAGEKPHICETCGKSFLTFYYLNKHIKSTHLKLRPFVCEYCSKCFCSRFALKTHVRQHTNETPYKCEVCGEGFRQNVSLRAHRKSKHNIIEPKNCACPVCGKMFGSEQAIISHMRLH